ncbi:MAG: DUF3800 domain-containing protein [Treponema sp.]|nr:DUF3800 domain-containing protein [Treponema sp.]
MKVLSIFVDESGDFGPYSTHCPYYVVTMVFHNQEKNISSQIEKLNSGLNQMNLREHTIHTNPLVRREENYEYIEQPKRRKIFQMLFTFALSCDIRYKTFIFSKKDFRNEFDLEGRMAKEIMFFVNEHLDSFQDFSNIILYYDNGQHQLNKILNAVFSIVFSQYELRIVNPSDYKLFQVADLICTLELINKRFETSEMTNSEKIMFHTKRDFKKDFYKGLRKKTF